MSLHQPEGLHIYVCRTVNTRSTVQSNNLTTFAQESDQKSKHKFFLEVLNHKYSNIFSLPFLKSHHSLRTIQFVLIKQSGYDSSLKLYVDNKRQKQRTGDTISPRISQIGNSSRGFPVIRTTGFQKKSSDGNGGKKDCRPDLN